jgi:hypothetical protein
MMEPTKINDRALRWDKVIDPDTAPLNVFNSGGLNGGGRIVVTNGWEQNASPTKFYPLSTDVTWPERPLFSVLPGPRPASLAAEFDHLIGVRPEPKPPLRPTWTGVAAAGIVGTMLGTVVTALTGWLW